MEWVLIICFNDIDKNDNDDNDNDKNDNYDDHNIPGDYDEEEQNLTE